MFDEYMEREVDLAILGADMDNLEQQLHHKEHKLRELELTREQANQHIWECRNLADADYSKRLYYLEKAEPSMDILYNTIREIEEVKSEIRDINKKIGECSYLKTRAIFG